MESCVAFTIGEIDRCPCLNEKLYHVWLPGNDSQVERGLQVCVCALCVEGREKERETEEERERERERERESSS